MVRVKYVQRFNIQYMHTGSCLVFVFICGLWRNRVHSSIESSRAAQFSVSLRQHEWVIWRRRKQKAYWITPFRTDFTGRDRMVSAFCARIMDRMQRMCLWMGVKPQLCQQLESERPTERFKTQMHGNQPHRVHMRRSGCRADPNWICNSTYESLFWPHRKRINVNSRFRLLPPPLDWRNFNITDARHPDSNFECEMFE